jgi:LPS-assembly protein
MMRPLFLTLILFSFFSLFTSFEFFNLFFLNSAHASPFSYQIGDDINITSNKGIRNIPKGTFEAIGNVVIRHKDESLYGEKASFDLANQQVDAVGNVRFVSPTMTMYGQELSYNMKSHFLKVQNARMMTQGYTLQGSYIARTGPNKIIADEAEFSTCLDCPEAWSVFGKKIELTMGEYIRIHEAYIKSKGTVVMYFPYLVLPVKSKRQTGLLFPVFHLNSTEGFFYRQPLFIDLGPTRDLTTTPAVLGMRGKSHEFEYRQVLGENKWFEINSFQSVDNIYFPNKPLGAQKNTPSGTHYTRFMGEYEHHFQWENFGNHHLYLESVRDVDVYSDYPYYFIKRIHSPYVPMWTFFNLKNNLFDFNIEGHYSRNMMVDNPVEFDPEFVQILPRMSLMMVPVPLLQTDLPFLQSFLVSSEAIFNRFRQRRPFLGSTDSLGIFHPNEVIRNADRLEWNGKLKWNLGSLGGLNAKTELTQEYMFYHFPSEEKQRSFERHNTVVVSSIFMEMERTFGVSYNVKIPVNEIRPEEYAKLTQNEADRLNKINPKSKEQNQTEKEKALLGTVPPLKNSIADEEINLSKTSYRHGIYLGLNHHVIPISKWKGSEKFAYQTGHVPGGRLSGPSYLFDRFDAPRNVATSIDINSFDLGFDQTNTAEFVFQSNLYSQKINPINPYEDGRFGVQNYTSTSIASFALSQPYRLNTAYESTGKWQERMERMKINVQFPIQKWSFSGAEYFFWLTKKQIFNVDVSHPLSDIGRTTLRWVYDSKNTPVSKVGTIDFSFRPIAILEASWSYSYDFVQRKYILSTYGVTYLPTNNCFRANIAYTSSASDTRRRQIVLNMMLNFGDNNFVPLLSPIGVGGR